MENLDRIAIKTLRTLSVEEINEANSGHPGIALGIAPTMYTLFTKVLKIYPFDSKWYNRDRFILAAGHGSSILYASLHLAGFDVEINDLKNFRKLHSKTPGHPEITLTSGIDASSGPLGQGIPEGVGMAIAESHLAKKFNKDGLEIINHYTYVLCGDGDLQEGITQEAMSLAGHLKLNKLIVLYDSNDIQLDGKVSMTNTENIKEKYSSMGFNYHLVKDGEDIIDIYKTIKKAQKSDKPSLIEIKTKIGYGTSLEGTNKVHGSPLPLDDVLKLRKELGGEPFSISSDVYNIYDQRNVLNKKEYAKEMKLLEKYAEDYPEDYKRFVMQFSDDFSIDFRKDLPNYSSNFNKATRVSSGEILEKLSKIDERLIGGSADLASSTKVKGVDGDFSSENRLGRNIVFGVREHAMAAICNGITLHKGLKGFCGGFFVFCDYMKPAMRLASIMKLPVLYIFTHDSIAVGEDGPTHQPIEQLTMLRSIPNMNVIRPADAVEVKEAFDVYLSSKENPTVLVLTRQETKGIREDVGPNLVSKGAYVIFPEEGELKRVIIASGSEVSLAIEVAKELKNTRVVSLPSFYLFDKQTKEYKEEVLPKGIKRIAIEASDATHFYKYLNEDDMLLNINVFGESANASIVIDYFGFTKEKVLEKIKD